jgi:hypothetical protein
MKEIVKPKNEEGFILIVTLIILVLLTLIGISASKTSEIEIRISGNEMRYKRNLYSAEAVAIECAQTLEDNGVLDGTVAWIKGMGTVTRDDILDDTYWTTESQVSAMDANARYLSEVEGIAEGTSLDMTKSRVHSYKIYGRWQNPTMQQEGRSIVTLGYKKAF